jgi:hypothetical protein
MPIITTIAKIAAKAVLMESPTIIAYVHTPYYYCDSSNWDIIGGPGKISSLARVAMAAIDKIPDQIAILIRRLLSIPVIMYHRIVTIIIYSNGPGLGWYY